MQVCRRRTLVYAKSYTTGPQKGAENTNDTKDIIEVIKKVSQDASVTDRPFNVLVNEVMGFITTQMNERKNKVANWLGGAKTGTTSTPEGNVPIFNRRWFGGGAPKSAVDRKRDDINRLTTKEGSSSVEGNIRPSSMRDLESVVESRIRNCDYKPDGKPIAELSEYQNPHIDSSTAQMNRMLLQNKALPRWIELDHEIRDLQAELDSELASVWALWKADIARNRIYANTTFRNCSHFHTSQTSLLSKVQKLSKLVLTFNLECPSMRLQKFLPSFEEIVKDFEEQARQKE